jgi:hypothetical protein
MPQLIYRISTSNPPDDDEYLTYEEQGRTFDRENPEEVQMSQGLSVLISLKEDSRQTLERCRLHRRLRTP